METAWPDDINLILLILRVVLGLTIAAHGYGKLFRGGRISGTAGWFDSMGMRPGRVHAVLAATTEVGTGILLVLGLLTSFAAAGLVGLMVVAGWTVHRYSGFYIVDEGWEYVFMLAVVAIAVATLGPGDWSVDSALDIDRDLDGWTGMAISAGLGLSAGIGLLAVFYRPPASSD